MGAISSINLLKNKIPVEQAQELVKIMQAKENLTTLCGLSREEIELDFSGQYLDAGDAVLIANDIRDMGALTSLNMSKNGLLSKEGGTVLGEMLKGNTLLKELDVSSSGESMPFSKKDGPGFAKELAVGISDNGALTSLDISDNNLTMGAFQRLDMSGKSLKWLASNLMMTVIFFYRCYRLLECHQRQWGDHIHCYYQYVPSPDPRHQV
jgi:hypothetical protein